MVIQMVICFVGNGGWTEPWNGNHINTNGWGIHMSFKLTKNGVEFSSGDVVRSL